MLPESDITEPFVRGSSRHLREKSDMARRRPREPKGENGMSSCSFTCGPGDIMLENEIDVWDMLDLQVTLEHLRRYLRQTSVLCSMNTFFCLSMMIFQPTLLGKLSFGVIGYAACLVGVLQTVLCLSKIIEINACLRAWRQSA